MSKVDNEGFELVTTATPEGVIVQELYANHAGVREQITRRVVNLQEQELVGALVKQGWLPPQAPHPDCNQCANRGKTYAMSQESSCDHCVWQQAAALIGYSRRTWQEWEAGRRIMRRVTLAAFCMAVAES